MKKQYYEYMYGKQEMKDQQLCSLPAGRLSIRNDEKQAQAIILAVFPYMAGFFVTQ